MTTMITKNSTTANGVPADGTLSKGELAVNIEDKKVWVGNASGNPVEILKPSTIEDGTTTGRIAVWNNTTGVWEETSNLYINSSGDLVVSNGNLVSEGASGHIRISSSAASLDYNTTDSKWTATDATGTFDLRYSEDTANVSFIGPIAPSALAASPEYGDYVWFDSSGSVGPDALVAGDTFLDFASAQKGKLGVLDRWTGTSSSDLGAAAFAGTITYDSDGFLVPNVSAQADFITYPAANLDNLQSVADRLTDGFTIQYEIENSVFATNNITDPSASATAEVTLLFVQSGTNVWSIAAKANTPASPAPLSASKWYIQINTGTAGTTGSTDKIETANLIGDVAEFSGTHSLITITVHGSSAGSTANRIDVYRNKSLILQTTPAMGGASLHDSSTYYIGGAGAYAGAFPYSPTGKIRNVLFIGNHTIPKRNIKMAVIGDSNISGGQYQAASSAEHLDNNPPLYGVLSNEAASVAAPQGTSSNPEYFYFRDESVFSIMEKYLADKKLYPIPMGVQKGISSYGLSGALIGNDVAPPNGVVYQGGLKERLDSMYGEGTNTVGPAPLTGADKLLDVVVVNLGGNDAFVWETNSRPDTYIDTLEQQYKIGLDRIIATSNPKVIVLTTFQSNINTAGNVPFNTHLAEINTMIRTLDGYKNICKVADVAANINRNTMHFDGVHYNPLGYQVLAQEVVKKIDISLDRYAVEKGDSAIYDGANWRVTEGRQTVGENGPVQIETGTTRTLTASDKNSIISFTSSSAITVTLPDDTSEELDNGFEVRLDRDGTGTLTVAAQSGATVNSAAGLTARVQYSSVTIVKTATNVYKLTGDSAV